MGPFNNREIATAIWLLVFAVWALRKADIRRSLVGVVRAFCCLKIIVPICLMQLYLAAAVAILAFFGLWKVALLKDTIVWFCVGAMPMMMHIATSDDIEIFFKKLLVDSVKIVIILEFLVNTYTFSLPVELIIVLALVVIGLVDTVASLDKKHCAVARLISGVQTIIVFVILAILLNRAISDLQSLHNVDTARSIALAPLLSLFLSPFLYVLALVFRYELLFLRLSCGNEKGAKLRQYARRRILMYAGLSLGRLQNLLRHHAVDLMRIQTEADVNRLLSRARSAASPASEVHEVEAEQTDP